MNAAPMINLAPASAPWICTSRAHGATTLDPSALPRWVHVHEGRVWLTAVVGPRHDDPLPPEDVWLDAGASLPLPPGSRWVLETWPGTRVSVVEDGCAVLRRAAAGGARRWISAWPPAWPRFRRRLPTLSSSRTLA